MRLIKTILFLSVLLLTFNQLYSQSKIIERGNDLFERHNYDDAIRLYLKAVEKGEKSAVFYANLADSYYHNADMENAVIWYKTLMNEGLETVKGEYYFRYSQALKAVGDYKTSDVWMNKLLALNADDSRANALKFDSNYLEKIEAQSGRYEIESVSVNTEYSDFGTGFGDHGVVFSSSRNRGGMLKGTHRWTGSSFLELYSAKISEEGNLIEAKKLRGDFNDKYNESSVAITNDGTTMYFTRNSYNKTYQEDLKGIIRLKLYKAKKKGDTWTDIVELPFNNTEYSVSHPALSADNKLLYFASDMPGTTGLSDLYKVEIHTDGTYSAPINLGKEINTEGRETFPYVSKSGDFYFSSDGHLGLGGLDVFVCNAIDSPSKKDNIFNIGKPINSKKDDFAFIIDDATKLGYFTSNRAGGKGSDDIYKLKQLDALVICETIVKGVVINKKTEEIIPHATVVVKNDRLEILEDIKADENGAFSFKMDCEQGTYTVTGSKETFIDDIANFTLYGTTSSEVALKLRLDMEPTDPEVAIGTDLAKYLNLNPIYFDYDKSFIRPDAEIELAKVINYMKAHPSVKIDVRSHTDSRGRDAYNWSLSTRRNTSTKDYIINNGGISRDRISGKGYGETKLVNRCSNGVKCSKAEHQANRRSEFIIVEN